MQRDAAGSEFGGVRRQTRGIGLRRRFAIEAGRFAGAGGNGADRRIFIQNETGIAQAFRETIPTVGLATTGFVNTCWVT